MEDNVENHSLMWLWRFVANIDLDGMIQFKVAFYVPITEVTLSHTKPLIKLQNIISLQWFPREPSALSYHCPNNNVYKSRNMKKIFCSAAYSWWLLCSDIEKLKAVWECSNCNVMTHCNVRMKVLLPDCSTLLEIEHSEAQLILLLLLQT